MSNDSKNLEEQLVITLTADNSYSLFRKDIGESYHSKNGAYTESMLVFISNGLLPLLSKFNPLNVLELGFGTGLNALLTHVHAPQHHIIYQTIEAFPLPMSVIGKLGYDQLPGLQTYTDFISQLHQSQWDINVELNEYFSLTKFQNDFLLFNFPLDYFHLVYFDAFSMESQSELWSPELFKKVYDSLKPGAVLVTYSSRGVVKRSLREVGFTVERLAGPPGKRHVLRATKG